MTHRNNTILATFTERQPGIVGAALRAGRRRAADTSQSMSRRGAMAAAAELVNTAAARLIELAYERDETGLCNVDPSTGVLFVSVPWSSRTYTRYGLRRTEADCLALHMRRLHQAPTVAPLFTFDESSRKWGVNLWDYKDFGAGVGYWRRHELSAAEYAKLLQIVRNGRAES